MERLQKVMAASGIASRRKCEEIIAQGRVYVNGQKITELGFKVTNKDEIIVDGKPICREEKVYYVLNKPTGYVSTVSDEHDRKTVLDLFEKAHLDKRIYPVGRLDYDTSGVLIMTNDGELTNQLTHPKSEVEKEYIARVKGIVSDQTVEKLRSGVKIDGIMTKRAKVKIESIDKQNESTSLRIIITEGRYHQVRNMCEFVGHPVKKLTRVRFGEITLDDLPQGCYRSLKIHEVKRLKALK